MSLFKKMFTFGRAIKAELEEEFTDAQAIRLLEQHIRDARQSLDQAGRSRIELAGKKKLAESKVANVKAEISKYENFAVEALSKGDEALATEVAEKIATLETRYTEDQAHLDTLNADFARIEGIITKSKKQLSEMERQLAQVKATEAVQKAQEQIAATSINANSKVANAAESLQRIKNKQAEKQAKLEAAEELSNEGDDLEKKLKAAGIGSTTSSANSVLERLKAKQSS
ncbi:PspA/IM30 family protein [Corallincola platygyrae]|uniref:PspA/IM30 family protein n=1 Tax=Corallincola platygyrae TaxID=1193278 RepID=A0ABW4XSB4_9GAMM